MTAAGRRSTHYLQPDERSDTDPQCVDWFQLSTTCYWALIDGDVGQVQRLARRIDRLGRHSPPAFCGRSEALTAALQALEGHGRIDIDVPTADLTLFGVAPVLASAEAVAIGGTQQAAADWVDWFDRAWPVHVLRAPSWPVLAQRVRALLACRAGDVAAGLRWMELAIQVADRIGSPVEAAIARVQYAELLALDPRHEARERWNEVRRSGRERCQKLRIPFEHHAHRARTAASLGRFDRVCATQVPSTGTATKLTRREIEVLRLFSGGSSYREAAVELGVGWRTIQSHAYNAYQKLGVSSKIAARRIAPAADLRLSRHRRQGRCASVLNAQHQRREGRQQLP